MKFRVDIINVTDFWWDADVTNFGCQREFDTYEEARDFLKKRLKDIEGWTKEPYEGDVFEID